MAVSDRRRVTAPADQTIWKAHREHLAGLDRQDRLRTLAKSSGTDFSSNDYLGLAASARLAQAVARASAEGVPVGSGGSRLLRGNHPEHEALEAEAATHFGSATALFFGSGYAANSALFSTLPQQGDLIVHDLLIHASAREGIRLSRAKAIAAGHNDPQAIDDAIVSWRKDGNTGQPWIAIESLYSMDGDRSPLEELAVIAERHGAMLLIDEAHATGVFGERGRGLAERLEGQENVISLRTCGKALGCEGALVCGPRTMRDFLINRARQFIFSTAPSPLIASAVREALKILADEPERQAALHKLMTFARDAFTRLGIEWPGSQIIPVPLGSEASTLAAASKLQDAGFDVRAIRPPTVPEGSSRLRISLTLNVTADDVRALAGAIEAALP